MLTSRKGAFAAVVAAVALGLSGVAAASPAFASGPVEPVPPCTAANEDTLVCLTHGELQKEGIRARVRVEDILCVKADALTDEQTANARIYVPCKHPRVPEFKNCAEASELGVTNIPHTDPRYRKKLDEDNDGVACETIEGGGSKDEVVEEAPKAKPIEADLPVTG